MSAPSLYDTLVAAIKEDIRLERGVFARRATLPSPPPPPREQVRFGEKLHAAFGSRGPTTTPNEHRNMWVARAYYVMQGLSGDSVPRCEGSWYGDKAPLFGEPT